MEGNGLQSVRAAADYVSERLKGTPYEGVRPVAGIVLGSGLGQLADKIEDQTVIPYTDIPGFPASTAMGHKGNYIFGRLGGKTVVAMQGRIHYYEGYGMDKVVLPIRVMMRLGIGYLFVSNAAGGVNFHFHVGDLMIIRDHINLLPNPLVGPNDPDEGPRFPDMTRPYDPKLIAKARKIARAEHIFPQEGTYLADSGPSYETPAEYRFYRTIGADAVGMSTVPEVIVARHADIPVFGMSVITNEAHDEYADDYANDGEDVVRAAAAASVKMSTLFEKMIRSLD